MRFLKLKNDILGKEYSLSIAFVAEKKSRVINKKYRKKNRATNVLSFSLYKNEGELVLCNAVIKKEAKLRRQPYGEWLLFLVIHGMLHLKGLEHSSTMEKQEKFYFEKYDKKHNSGNRRRLLDDKSSGRRVHQGRKKP